MADDVQSLIKRQTTLEGNRSNWESLWQDLAELFMPKRADFTTQPQPGERRTERQFDGTPMLAARALASSLDGLLKPKSERWFIVESEDDNVNQQDDVKGYLEFIEERMWQALYNPEARFLQKSAEVDLDLTVFGTGILFLGEPKNNALDFRSHHLRTMFLAENDRNIIDTVFRKFRLTARQAVQQFGRERVGTDVVAALSEDAEKEFEYLHVVLPREEIDREKPRNLRMPWASVWIDVKREKKIFEGGFEEFPYIIPRWETSTGEVYGRSPGMIALPDAETLNQQAKTLLQAGHKAVDPPLWAPHDGLHSAPRTWPGGITYFKSSILDRTRGRPPMFAMDTGANIPLGREMQNDTRDQIWQAFFRNVLNLPTGGPEMTATEVLERRAEFVRLIGPTFGRLEADYTERLINRVFGVMFRTGMLGPREQIPEALQGKNLRFKFVSPITKAIEQIQAAAFKKTAEDIADIAVVKPEVLDHFDTDQITRDVSKANGMPTKWLLPVEGVLALREQRAQALAAQAQAEAQAQAGQALIQGGEALAKADSATDITAEATEIA